MITTKQYYLKEIPPIIKMMSNVLTQTAIIHDKIAHLYGKKLYKILVMSNGFFRLISISFFLCTSNSSGRLLRKTIYPLLMQRRFIHDSLYLHQPHS